MFIITNVKELAIWLTETPFDKRSGVWNFYNTREDYDFDLKNFTNKYSSKFQFTLKRITDLYQKRSED